MKIRLCIALISFTVGCATTSAKKTSAIIYTNATVLTLDNTNSTAIGLRTDNGFITDIYSTSIPSDATGQKIDLQGATILPGLVDAHLHLRGLGRAARQLNLRGTESIDDVQGQVAQIANTLTPSMWIRGRGWDQNDWPTKEFPNAQQLDRITIDHPIWLTRIDGHAVWLNSMAMDILGITNEVKAPEGGEILRDAEGNLTGIFIDNAIDLLREGMPAATAQEIEADLLRGQEICNQVGLTGVHDMGTSVDIWNVLQKLEERNLLTLRITSYLSSEALSASALPSSPDKEGLLRTLGVKLFADGALGSRGAALLQPYTDRPNSSGLVLTPPDKLADQVKLLQDKGFQAAIHAIGDRGNRVALDAILKAQKDDLSRRHRIEHVQVITPQDQTRMKDGQVIASMQPTHCTSDMPWAESRLGPERVQNAYAWRRLKDQGISLAFGSDAPVEEVNPWHGVYAGVTRQDHSHKPEGGWYPNQRLTITEVLEGFTKGAAHAAHQPKLGFLAPGNRADLTIVAENPITAPPNNLITMKIIRTIVNGKEVYRAPSTTIPLALRSEKKEATLNSNSR